MRKPTPAGEAMLAQVPDEWNLKTQRVIGLAMEVHSILGPGLVERLYEDALSYELGRAGFSIKRQHPIRLRYKEIELGEQRLDLVVDDLVVLELKSVDAVSDLMLAQLVSYLRSARLPLGLLINFNVPPIKDGIYRRLNPVACPKAPSPDQSVLSASL